MTDHRPTSAPLPLLVGFGLFVAVLGYLVAAALGRREAPTYTPTPLARTRSADWMRTGDTLTLDATDGDRWHYASLARGHALTTPDTAGWELAARRYRITAAGALADLGVVPFEHAVLPRAARFVASRPDESANAAIAHWYRYGLLTHLLMPDGRVYALRTAGGALWKVEVLGYYCPRLVAGCLTLRYAPLAAATR
jgi:hypothetical protein